MSDATDFSLLAVWHTNLPSAFVAVNGRLSKNTRRITRNWRRKFATSFRR